MIYKLEMRWDRESEWFESTAGDHSYTSRWDSPEDADHAFLATVERWSTLSHRLVKCDDNGEPLAVVAILDLGRIEDLL